MTIDQLYSVAPDRPLVEAAWSVLDAANDFRYNATVEACRRVIDASLRGDFPAESDMNFVFDFSNS
jgi:hypothetical protein